MTDTRTFAVEETTFHCHAEPGGGEVMEIRYRVGADRTFSEWRRIDGSEASRRWWREWSPDPFSMPVLRRLERMAFRLTSEEG